MEVPLSSERKTSSFLANVFKVSFFNIWARIIPVISLPFLQRLVYSPEDFGLYGFFFTIASIYGTICSLNYDVASSWMIKEGHYSYTRYAFSIMLYFFLILMLASFLFSIIWFDNGIYVLLVILGCLAGFGLALTDLLSTILSSLLEPVKSAKATFLSSIVNEGIRWMGILSPSGITLALARVFSIFMGIIYLLIHLHNKYSNVIWYPVWRISILWSFFKKYSQFQIYLWTSSIMATFNMQLPVLFFTFTNQVEMAGLFTASAAYIMGMTYFISRGIQQVLYSALINKTFHISKVKKKYILVGTLLYMTSVLLFFLLPDSVFGYFLGEKWQNMNTMFSLVWIYGIPAGTYWCLYPCITFFNLKKTQFIFEILRTVSGVLAAIILPPISLSHLYMAVFSTIQFLYFTGIIAIIFTKGKNL